jgi:hypothetical protein
MVYPLVISFAQTDLFCFGTIIFDREVKYSKMGIGDDSSFRIYLGVSGERYLTSFSFYCVRRG